MTLRFLGGGAAQGIVAAIARLEGIEIDGSFGPVGAMQDKLLAGEACDAVALTHAQVAGLIATRAVDARVVSDIGTVRTMVAARSGDPMPDVSTPAALRTALLACTALHFPDPAKATAGIHFAKVLASLGIADALAARVRTYPGGLPAMAALAKGGAGEIGCTQATEILATPGVTVAGALPDPHGLATVYTAAVVAGSPNADPGRGFIARMTAPANAGVRASLGFEGAIVRRAEPADAPRVRELVYAILRDYRLTPDPAGTDRDLEDLGAAYFSRGGAFDVAIAPDGALVASCGTYRVDDSTFELRKMYVRRDQRGQGLGKRLLERSLAFARSRSARLIELETASVLTEAMAMYEKAGFVRREGSVKTPRCDRAYELKLARQESD